MPGPTKEGDRDATDPKNEQRVYNVSDGVGWVTQVKENDMPEAREEKAEQISRDAPTQPSAAREASADLPTVPPDTD